MTRTLRFLLICMLLHASLAPLRASTELLSECPQSGRVYAPSASYVQYICSDVDGLCRSSCSGNTDEDGPCAGAFCFDYAGSGCGGIQWDETRAEAFADYTCQCVVC